MQNNKLILFIHGLTGGRKSFGKFFELIEQDTDLGLYDTAAYEYSTSFLFPSPKIQSLSNDLKGEIETKYSHYDEIIFVCHSMGGLIAKKYLLEEVTSIKNSVSSVSKLLLYAVPNIGSDLALLFWHPQVRQLNRESDFLEFLNSEFKKNKISEYIDILYVVGSLDKIVNRTSASGFWADGFKEIENKGHFFWNGIAKPKNSDDKTFLYLKDFVLKKKSFIKIDQPNLYIEELTNNQEIQKFNYKSTFLPYLGREKEKEILSKFIRDEKKFSWIVIHEAGGSGKSRLAFEFAKQMYTAGTMSGFFDITSSFSWAQWLPAQPTLIIIDYAGNNPKEISEVITILTNRKSEFRYGVRLLLLERNLEYPNAWYEKIFEGSGNINSDSMYCEPLALSVLDDESLYAIARHFNMSVTVQKNDFIEQLTELDPKRRPLFSALLGDALSHSGDSKMLNRTSIIKTYLHRTYEKYWGEIPAEYFVIAIIITLCLKSEKSTFFIANEKYMPSEKDFNPDILERVLIDSDAESYIALQPDLIGELFVLEYFNFMNKDFNESGAPRYLEEKQKFILEHVWKCCPAGIASFLYKCGQDFLNHKSLEKLTEIDWIDFENNQTTLFWVSLVSSFMTGYISQNDTRKAEEICDKLQDVFEKKSTSLEFAHRKIVSYINAMKDQGTLGKGGNLSDDIDAQKMGVEISRFNEILKILTTIAQTFHTHMTEHIKEGNMIDARKVFDKIQVMLNSSFHNDELPLIYIHAYRNLIIGYITDGNIKDAQNSYSALEKIISQHSNSAKIVSVWATITFELINGYISDENIKDAQIMYNNLKNISKKNSDNSEVLLNLAKGSYNLIVCYIQNTKFKEAIITFESLRSFYNPNYVDVVEVFENARALLKNFVNFPTI